MTESGAPTVSLSRGPGRQHGVSPEGGARHRHVQEGARSRTPATVTHAEDGGLPTHRVRAARGARGPRRCIHGRPLKARPADAASGWREHARRSREPARVRWPGRGRSRGTGPLWAPVAAAPASLEDAFAQTFVARRADGDPRGRPRSEPRRTRHRRPDRVSSSLCPQGARPCRTRVRPRPPLRGPAPPHGSPSRRTRPGLGADSSPRGPLAAPPAHRAPSCPGPFARAAPSAWATVLNFQGLICHSDFLQYPPSTPWGANTAPPPTFTYCLSPAAGVKPQGAWDRVPVLGT